MTAIGQYEVEFRASDDDGNTTSYQGSKTFTVVEVNNDDPILNSSSASPASVTVNNSVTLASVWKDSDSDSIIDVKARYRKTGTSSWTEVVLDAISGEVDTGYTFNKAVSMTAIGQYEVEFQASDDDSNTTSYQGSKTFTVVEKNNLPKPEFKFSGNEIPTILFVDQSYEYSLNFSTDLTNQAKCSASFYEDGNLILERSLLVTNGQKVVDKPQASQAGRNYRMACQTFTGNFNNPTELSEESVWEFQIKSASGTISSVAVDPTSGTAGVTDFTFSATLSSALATGQYLALNFDDLAGGWLSQNTAGGHTKLSGSNTAYNVSTKINSAGIRKYRIGIFNASDELVGNYIEGQAITVSYGNSIQDINLSRNNEDGLDVTFKVLNNSNNPLTLKFYLSNLNKTGESGTYLAQSEKVVTVTNENSYTVQYTIAELEQLYSGTGTISAKIDLQEGSNEIVSFWSLEFSLATNLSVTLIKQHITYDVEQLSSIELQLNNPLPDGATIQVGDLSPSLDKISETHFSYTFSQEQACQITNPVKLIVFDKNNNKLKEKYIDINNINQTPNLIVDYIDEFISEDANFEDIIRPLIKVEDANNNLSGEVIITSPDLTKLGSSSQWSVAATDSCGLETKETGTVFIHKSNDAWQLIDRKDENYDDNSNVDMEITGDKVWYLTNLGDRAWQNFKIRECADQQGNNCTDTNISVPYTPIGEKAEINLTFTTPDTSGRYERFFQLIDSSGAVVKSTNNLPTFWLKLNVIDGIKKRCDLFGSDSEMCQNSNLIGELFNKCKSEFGEDKIAPFNETLSFSNYEIVTKVDPINNKKLHMWAEFTSTIDSVALNNIGTLPTQGVDEFNNLINEFENTVHQTPKFTLMSPSENIVSYCEWKVETDLFPIIIDSFKKDQAVYMLKQLKELKQNILDDHIKDNKRKSSLSLGSLDAVQESLDQITEEMHARANIGYAISMSFKDFFINDALEIKKLMAYLENCGEGIENCLEAELIALRIKIEEIENIIKAIDDLPEVNLGDFIDRIGDIANDIDVEGTWRGTINYAKLMDDFKFKEAFAKYFDVDEITMNQDEFSYLVGYQGTLLINEYIELVAAKKVLSIMKKTIVNGAGKKIAKKAALSLFKVGKVGSKLLKGGIAAEKIKTDSTNAIAQIKAASDIFKNIKTISFDDEPIVLPTTNPMKSSKPADTNINNLGEIGPWNWISLWRECLFSEKTYGCLNIKTRVESADKKNLVRYLSRPKLRYILDSQNTGISVNQLKKNTFGKANYLIGENCQVHHILPKETKSLVMNFKLSPRAGYYYYLDDPSNALPLPNKACLNSKTCVCNTGNNVRHVGSHNAYNILVTNVLEQLHEKSVFENFSELLVLREGLRMSLVYGRSILSLNKVDEDKAYVKKKPSKTRNKTKILTLFSKYPLLHSKSN